MTPLNIPLNSTIVEFEKSTKVFNSGCIVKPMKKISAEESYKRMAEFVIESGVTNSRQITQKIVHASQVSFESVNKWKNGATKSITMPPISNFCDKYKANPNYIASGIGPRYQKESANFEPANLPPEARKAPVIDYVEAGEWAAIADPYPLGAGETWEYVSETDSEYVFWLRVKGDSMTAPTGQSVPEGFLIKVDPTQEAKNGSLVVAKLEDSQEATFKKLVFDAGMKFLKPLNPDYPTIQINGNCRIVGVVTEAKVKF